MVNANVLGTLVVVAAMIALVAVLVVTLGPLVASAIHVLPGR